MNVSEIISRLKLKTKTMTPDKVALINELHLVWSEVQETRKEVNLTIKRTTCADALRIRKSILIKMIKIRNYISKTLIDNFSIEISRLQDRDFHEKNQTPKWSNEFDKFIFSECEHLCKLREKSTGLKWNTDHMIPLRGKLSSGLHCGLNFQVIPQYLNSMKNNKPIMTEHFDWISFA